MKISVIAAIGKNGELGKDNKLLWHIPEDLKSFKRLTLNHMVLMGNKTFASIGKPLINRVNLVLSKIKNQKPIDDTVKYFCRAEDAISYAEETGEKELFIIGGASIYELFLPIADSIILSRVDWEGDADCFFPKFDENKYKLMEYKRNEAYGKVPYWELYRLDRKNPN